MTCTRVGNVNRCDSSCRDFFDIELYFMIEIAPEVFLLLLSPLIL